MVKVDVEGIEDVVARLDRVLEYKSVLRSCVVKSLAEMKNRSKSLTPVGKTRQLRDSAFSRVISSFEGEFGYTKEYAPYVEFGHRIKIHGKNVGFQPANPYLEPNAKAQQPIFQSDCQEAIARLTK